VTDERHGVWCSGTCGPPPLTGGGLTWSILMVYTGERGGLVTTTAKLFKNGRSQALRLPREFRFEGDRVRVRRVGRGVLVEPMFTDVPTWFDELDRLATEPFMPEGRKQPPSQRRPVFDDDVPA
jgi:antitoxin VapB